MKRNIYLVFGVIVAVRGVFISDFMSRNPTNDNRATLSTNVISTLIFGSSMHCASHCTRNDECKSIMFNMDTHSCKLLSIHMSDTGPQNSTGWLYYEKKIDEPMSTTLTPDVVTTEVSSGITQSTFEGTMPTTATVNVKTTVVSTETPQTTFEGTMPTTATVNVKTTAVSTETPQTTFDCSIWHQHLGHWYILDTKERTFNNSRSFCASLSPPSYVIEVDSQAENDWLIELVSSEVGGYNFYWLNGYDTDNSGTFTWIDSQTPTNYTDWYPGEPSDNSGTSEKCITLKTGFFEGWHDFPCSSRKPVVCERDS